MGNDVILVLVVITALAFDFTNGFHDTGNAMATSIATGALSPRLAVALSGVLNLVGAFLSLAVAATIASGLVDTKVVTLTVVAAGLTGGIDYIPLFALLGSQLSESDVHAIAQELENESNPESGEAIRKAITMVTDHAASDADVARVRSRLAAGGWPLAKPEHFDPANWP